jgi:hypothetical protein
MSYALNVSGNKAGFGKKSSLSLKGKPEEILNFSKKFSLSI